MGAEFHVLLVIVFLVSNIIILIIITLYLCHHLALFIANTRIDQTLGDKTFL